MDAVFQSAAILSSTGYGTVGLLSLSLFMQFFIVGIMFMGGSVGSTSGGVKTFRIMTLYRTLKNQLRAYSLPDTAVNKVKVDGEILDNQTLQTISVLFFSWILVIFAGTGLTMIVGDVSFMGALSGVVSSAGNMGHVFMESEAMVGLSAPVKILWTIVMIAGRLEMLPVLAIFNRKVLSS
jgi:trk system potassium uptake protein TrkH